MQLVITSAMFGVIWIVQLVHYPMFAGLDRNDFLKWHKYHSDRITWVVAPLMVAELGLAGFGFYEKAQLTTAVLLTLTIAIWAATFLQSVPIHTALGVGRLEARSELLRKLILTNWIRTCLYSIKIVFLLALAV